MQQKRVGHTPADNWLFINAYSLYHQSRLSVARHPRTIRQYQTGN